MCVCVGGVMMGKDTLKARIRVGEEGTEAGKCEGPVAGPVVRSEHILTTSHSRTHILHCTLSTIYISDYAYACIHLY